MYWHDVLDAEERRIERSKTMTSVYLFCAILGTTIVVISLFVGFLGLGGDGIDGGDVIDAPSDSVDAGAVHDGGAGFLRAFSFKSLSAGIAFFGLAGLAALELEASQGLAAGIATLCGAIAMWGVYRLMERFPCSRFGNRRGGNGIFAHPRRTRRCGKSDDLAAGKDC